LSDQAHLRLGFSVPADCESALILIDTDPDDPLNEIVVTATRSRSRQARRWSRSSSSIAVRSRTRSLLTSAMCCAFHAGLDIGRSGGPGQPLSLFIRGANSDQSIIMIGWRAHQPGTIGGAPLQISPPNSSSDRDRRRAAFRDLRHGCNRRRGQSHHAHWRPYGCRRDARYGRYATASSLSTATTRRATAACGRH